MHIARIVLITVTTAVALVIGIVTVVATGGSPASTPIETPVVSIAPPARESTTGSHTVPTSLPDVPSELTAAERGLVAWVTERFAEVGLVLPVIDISFHEDKAPCDGSDGIYHGGHRRRVLVCIPDRGTFASDLERQRTLVHELAHAWEQENLSDTERQGLLEILGAADWYAAESAWEDRGAERFAETIVWGLYDQVRRPTLIDVECGELHAAFREITGHGATGPLSGNCHLERS